MEQQAAIKINDHETNEPAVEYVGICPRCKGDVFMDKYTFHCQFVHDGSCDFEVERKYYARWGEKRSISKSGFQCLLKGGKIPLKGLVSPFINHGCPFDAYGVLRWLGQNSRWGIKFVGTVWHKQKRAGAVYFFRRRPLPPQSCGSTNVNLADHIDDNGYYY